MPMLQLRPPLSCTAHESRTGFGIVLGGKQHRPKRCENFQVSPVRKAVRAVAWVRTAPTKNAHSSAAPAPARPANCATSCKRSGQD
jgi:hypothetical protein